MNKDVSADGLRGLAATNVLLCHLLISMFPGAFANIYPDPGASRIPMGVIENVIAFPPLSALWNGQFAVCIFFVLSGYVLTKQYLVTGDISVLRLRAARRYARLCVPILGATMFAYLVMSLGLNHAPAAAALSGSRWLTQFWGFAPNWLDALRDGTYGAILGGGSAYNPSLWTMKIELLGSMLVFAYVLLNVRGTWGIANLIGLTVVLAYFFPVQWPLYAAFLVGSHVGNAPKTSSRSTHVILAIVALYCGGFELTRWYEWSTVIPFDDQTRKNVFNVIGGAALLYLVRCGILDRLLQSRPLQYLGRISYGFYLVHLPIVLSFSMWLYLWLVAELHWHRAPAAVGVILATFLIVCVVATAFDRTFDQWGIALSRKSFPTRSVALPTITTKKTV